MVRSMLTGVERAWLGEMPLVWLVVVCAIVEELDEVGRACCCMERGWLKVPL